MKRTMLPIGLLVFFVGCGVWQAHYGAAQPARQGLPGARPEIDAAQFPSLQAALDALPADGGIVRLPAGTFEIHQPLRVRAEDVCLVGAGTATHLKNVATDGQPALILAHPEHRGEGNDRNHSLWRIRLADFRITGNESSGHGIVAHNINEVFIDGVTVSQHGGDGVLLNHCYEDARVCDSLVTYNRGTGLNLLGCHDIVVASSQFEENQDAVRCIDGFNLCMTGNCLDDHLGRGVVIENTYGSVLSGNMIEECQGAAVVLDRDCYGITLSANVIAHNGAGVRLLDAHGCAVSANTFTIMKEDAVFVGPRSGRIAIAGNSFSSSYIGDGRDKRAANDQLAAGLTVAGARDVLVRGNLFSGLDAPAVHVGDSAGASGVVAGNLFVGNEPGVTAASAAGLVQQSNHRAD